MRSRADTERRRGKGNMKENGDFKYSSKLSHNGVCCAVKDDVSQQKMILIVEPHKDVD